MIDFDRWQLNDVRVIRIIQCHSKDRGKGTPVWPTVHTIAGSMGPLSRSHVAIYVKYLAGKQYPLCSATAVLTNLKIQPASLPPRLRCVSDKPVGSSLDPVHLNDNDALKIVKKGHPSDSPERCSCACFQQASTANAEDG